jgi:uncharacterized protein YndB with AHSA1/START domain
LIAASPEAIYHAFTNPAALETWQAPDTMTGKVHHFDGRVGGGYQMSLYYTDTESRGKTADREDRYTARFVELVPNERIVQAITFETTDPAFSGEMTMEITLELRDEGTNVVIVFTGIPAGIRPEDNEAGTDSSLEKLARHVEGLPDECPNVKRLKNS